MTNYRIRYDWLSFGFSVDNDDILIACNDLKHLSDNEQMEFVSDSLIHEYIHKIIFDWFDKTTCSLFDAIQQHFRNTKLHEKQINDSFGQITYHQYIKKCGFGLFLNHYGINTNMFNQAYIICNTRVKGGEN